MLMRAFILAAAVLAAPPVLAQETSPPPSAAAPSPIQIEGARDTLNFLMFESGLLEQTVGEMATAQLPALRERAADSELRNSLSERGRAALDLYVEEAPALIEAQVREGARQLNDLAAADIASVFTAEEWTGLAAFLRSDDGGTLFLKLANGDRASITDEEMQVVMQFYDSPAGRAFAARGAEMNRRLMASMERHMPLIMAGMRVNVLRRLCDALADECPTQMRNSINDL